MFSKYFFCICALMLFTAVVSSAVEEVTLEAEEDETEERNPALAIAIRVIMQAVRWAAKHCAKEAAQNCRQHWKHPRELVHCAKGFLEANKGRCVAG